MKYKIVLVSKEYCDKTGIFREVKDWVTEGQTEMTVVAWVDKVGTAYNGQFLELQFQEFPAQIQIPLRHIFGIVTSESSDKIGFNTPPAFDRKGGLS